MNLAAHLHRQREWSELRFGTGPRTAALCDHVHKELAEIAAAPTDPEEWVDVAILAFDGALRTGATPEQIVEILIGKQAKNEVRRWPDPATADPDKAAEHLRPEGSSTVRKFKVGDRVRLTRWAGDDFPKTDSPPIGWEGTIVINDETNIPFKVDGHSWPNDNGMSWYWLTAENLDLVAAA